MRRSGIGAAATQSQPCIESVIPPPFHRSEATSRFVGDQSEMGLGFSVSFRKRGLETSSSERIRKPHCEVAVCACCGWSPAARSTY